MKKITSLINNISGGFDTSLECEVYLKEYHSSVAVSDIEITYSLRDDTLFQIETTHGQVYNFVINEIEKIEIYENYSGVKIIDIDIENYLKLI